MSLTVGSLFSGIGGFDLGLERAGHRVLWQVEVDKRCRQVLRRHWPDVDLYEDVRDVGRTNLTPVDLICGGFPCQDLSVAGRRAGLDGARSGLWFEFHRIVHGLRPTWVLVENVPGLRSSDEGGDLALIIRGLAELGYVGAWRSPDSQYFGLAQRRERIYLLACRDPRAGCPAEVLALAEGMSGHPAPSREAGARVAGGAQGSSGDEGGGVRAYGGNRTGGPIDVATALNAHGGPHGRQDFESETFLLAPTLRVGGREQGAGSSYDNTPVVAYRKAQKAHDPDDCERWEEAEQTETLAGHGTTTGEIALAYDMQNDRTGELCGTLQGEAQRTGNRGYGVLDTIPRRLQPIECERLQGFPDDWTRYADDGTEIKDGPRYRMLGNAVSVPVAEWIGRRFPTTTPDYTEAP